MDIMQILPWAIFGFITCVVLGLMSIMNTRKSRTMERLEELRDPTLRDKDRLGKEKNGMTAALERAAPSLSQAIAPQNEGERNQLKLRLASAGYNNPNATSMFLTIKVIALGLGVLLGGKTLPHIWRRVAVVAALSVVAEMSILPGPESGAITTRMCSRTRYQSFGPCFAPAGRPKKIFGRP